MKKILLSISFLFAVSASAQVTVWSDNFNDEDISDWTLIDADGDTRNWGDQFAVTDTDGFPVTPISLISRSWQGVPLFPDNWAISPAINLTGATGPINLTWVVQAAAESWSQENYSVYVATANTTTALLASPVTFNEIYPGGTTGASLSRTLNMSSFAGQTVYVAFRHHNTTDMDFLSIDDVTVSAAALGVNDQLASNFSVLPNPVNDLITITNSENIALNNITIADINGRIVKSVRYNSVNAPSINVSDLSSGMYMMTIDSERGSITKKIIKN